MSTAGWLMLMSGVWMEMAGREMVVAGGDMSRAGCEMTEFGWETVVTGLCMETTGGKPCGPPLPPELKIPGLMSSGGLLASVTVTYGSSSSG